MIIYTKYSKVSTRTLLHSINTFSKVVVTKKKSVAFQKQKNKPTKKEIRETIPFLITVYVCERVCVCMSI